MPWCWVCHTPPGRDCPARCIGTRQVRRMLKRELQKLRYED